jgi:Uma2 family endonuclease
VLAVEIARSSLSIDRAKAAEYWIVDTERRRLEVRRGPSGDEYGFRRTLGEADRVAGPERTDDVAVAELLP